MKKLFLLNTLIWCGFAGFAQLTLAECYAKAKTNYPLIKQADLIEKSRGYNVSNAAVGYLPQVSFSAKASYQSEVTEIPISLDFIDIPSLTKEQYGATLNINQTVWDGGATKSRKESIRTASDLEKQNLEVDLYAINERVNQLFFGILLLEAQIEQNRLFQEELQRNYDQISAFVKNGIAHQADLDAVRVEQLKALQSKSQLTHSKKAFAEMLSAMIGEKLAADVTLVKPEPIVSNAASIQRPELELFNTRIKNLEAQNKEINAGLMPNLGVYFTGGYGKPGLNMLKNDPSAYYIVGANLSWNLSSFYTNKNSKNLIQTSIYSVQAQQETFLFNVQMDISQKQSEIEKFREQMTYDDEIIALRTSVKQSSEARMASGTLSGIDLMRDVAAEDMARQAKILHEIELLLAMYNLKFTTN